MEFSKHMCAHAPVHTHMHKACKHFALFQWHNMSVVASSSPPSCKLSRHSTGEQHSDHHLSFWGSKSEHWGALLPVCPSIWLKIGAFPEAFQVTQKCMEWHGDVITSHAMSTGPPSNITALFHVVLLQALWLQLNLQYVNTREVFLWGIQPLYNQGGHLIKTKFGVYKILEESNHCTYISIMSQGRRVILPLQKCT